MQMASGAEEKLKQRHANNKQYTRQQLGQRKSAKIASAQPIFQIVYVRVFATIFVVVVVDVL